MKARNLTLLVEDSEGEVEAAAHMERVRDARPAFDRFKSNYFTEFKSNYFTEMGSGQLKSNYFTEMGSGLGET